VKDLLYRQIKLIVFQFVRTTVNMALACFQIFVNVMTIMEDRIAIKVIMYNIQIIKIRVET